MGTTPAALDPATVLFGSTRRRVLAWLLGHADEAYYLNVYDNADVVSPRLIASRAFGASAVIADAEAWKSLEDLQS